MLLMEFSQKGINRLRDFHEEMRKQDPDGELEVSEGFDEGALIALPALFIVCSSFFVSVELVQGSFHQMP